MATIPASAAPPSTSSWRASDILAALLALGALGWSYAPSFIALVHQWDRDPNYSYGYFVIPIALLIFWSRRDRLDRARLSPRWWGFLPLLGIMGLRYLLYEWNEQYVETATIPLSLAAVALALGGCHLLEVGLPSIVFLYFMLPLPPSLNQFLAGPLQTFATLGSVALLQVIGLPVIAEGNVILVGQESLEVARACNGLSMLLSFITLITAVVILVRRPLLDRVLLLLSAVPIALISNIIRITVTGMVYHWAGHEWGETMAHDLAGWAMMPIALALVWLELQVYAWLLIEIEDVNPRTLTRRIRG